MSKIITYLLPLLVVLCDIGSPTTEFQFKLYLYALLLQIAVLLHDTKEMKNVFYTVFLFGSAYILFAFLFGLVLSVSFPALLIIPIVIAALGTVIVVVINFIEQKIKLKNWLSIALFCFVPTILAVFLGGTVRFLVSGLTYGFAAYWLKYKGEYSVKSILSVLSLLLILLLPMAFFHYHVIPLVLFPIISILVSAQLFPLTNNRNKVFSIIYGIVIFLLAIYVEPNYQVLNSRRPNISLEIPEGFTFSHLNTNKKVGLENLRGKITIIDFWTNHCGVCFKKFPELEKVYQYYKNDTNVQVFAVNLPHEDPSDSLFAERVDKFITKKGFEFPVLKSDSSYEYHSQKLSFDGVPHILVLDETLNIAYRGFLYVDDNIKIDNIFDIVTALKKN